MQFHSEHSNSIVNNHYHDQRHHEHLHLGAIERIIVVAFRCPKIGSRTVRRRSSAYGLRKDIVRRLWNRCNRRDIMCVLELHVLASSSLSSYGFAANRSHVMTRVSRLSILKLRSQHLGLWGQDGSIGDAEWITSGCAGGGLQVVRYGWTVVLGTTLASKLWCFVVSWLARQLCGSFALLRVQKKFEWRTFYPWVGKTTVGRRRVGALLMFPVTVWAPASRKSTRGCDCKGHVDKFVPLRHRGVDFCGHQKKMKHKEARNKENNQYVFLHKSFSRPSDGPICADILDDCSHEKISRHHWGCMDSRSVVASSGGVFGADHFHMRWHVQRVAARWTCVRNLLLLELQEEYTKSAWVGDGPWITVWRTVSARSNDGWQNLWKSQCVLTASMVTLRTTVCTPRCCRSPFVTTEVRRNFGRMSRTSTQLQERLLHRLQLSDMVVRLRHQLRIASHCFSLWDAACSISDYYTSWHAVASWRDDSWRISRGQERGLWHCSEHAREEVLLGHQCISQTEVPIPWYICSGLTLHHTSGMVRLGEHWGAWQSQSSRGHRCQGGASQSLSARIWWYILLLGCVAGLLSK